MDQWFYVVAGAQQGPISVEQLRGLISSGQVSLDTQVWCERMANWEPANRVPDFSFVAQPGGQPVSPGYAPLGYQSAAMPGMVSYGGFWLRFGAAFIDGLVLLVPRLIVIGVGYGIVAGGRMDQTGAALVNMLMNLVSIGISWLYFAMMESSPRQATLGKQACGLKVTDEMGNPVSFGLASGRFFGKIVSAIICYVGFMMAGWTQKKQGLHDIMAHTLVVRA
jgi:uncharacterized RDD family membrane protein YckC